MNVLSLFDGISGGRLALKRADIPITNYFASEIDKYAIQVAQKNFPDTVQMGDVNNWESWKLPRIDLIIIGAPCQSWSVAGKAKGEKDKRGNLFLAGIEIIKKLKPKYFLIENVRMKNEFANMLTELIGVDPIMIDSALVSAQRRQRYYWCNFPAKYPESKGISLQSILETNDIPVVFSSSGRGNGVIERRMSCNKKAHTLTATGYSKRSFSGAITEQLQIRNLTTKELARLQTFPDDYISDEFSYRQHVKMLGNAFTVDVIAHILKGIK